MIKNTYKIADVVFDVESINDFVHYVAREYLSDEMPQFAIRTNQNLIDIERKISKEYNDIDFRDGYLESLAVARLLADRLLDFDIFLFHGACISIDGDGYIFTAQSGVGKTTHINYLREAYGDKIKIINGDKPFVRIKDDEIIAYGSPWNGKENYGENTKEKLKGIISLNRGEKNSIEKISLVSIYPTLLSQINRPDNDDKYISTLSLIDKMLSKLDYYKLYCTNSIDSAKTTYEALKKA